VKPNSDVYVAGNTATISYRIARQTLSTTLVNNIGEIYVAPVNDDEAAMLLCDANAKTIADIEAGGGTFNVTTDGQATGLVLASINASSL
jgi:hypothetical protein